MHMRFFSIDMDQRWAGWLFSCTVRLMAGAAVLALAGCSPALNWREVRPEATSLRLLLPCKPDRAEKSVPLGGQPALLRLMGCDADGATFAVAVATLALPAGANPANVLAQWQSLSLVNMGAPAQPASALPLKIQGWQAVAGMPLPLRIRALGKRADGTPVAGEMAFFAQGSEVFQVVVYAAKLTPEMADTFFDSLVFEQ